MDSDNLFEIAACSSGSIVNSLDMDGVRFCQSMYYIPERYSEEEFQEVEIPEGLGNVSCHAL